MTDYRLKLIGTNNEWSDPGDPIPPLSSSFKQGVDLPLGMQYTVIDGPNWQVGPNGVTASYTYRIHVQDTDAFMRTCRGWSELGEPNFLKRHLPLRDPDGYGMICDGAMAAYQSPSGFSTIEQARDAFFTNITDRTIEPQRRCAALFNYTFLTVHFFKPLYDVVSDADMVAVFSGKERVRYCTAIETFSSEYVQLDRGVLYWNDAANPAYIAAVGGGANTPKPTGIGGGVLRSLGELVITWHRVPAAAISSLRARWILLLGSVNDAVFTVLPVGGMPIDYPLGTLMFRPWQLRLTMNGAGGIEYDVELHWAYREIFAQSAPDDVGGWNYQLYPNGRYYHISWKDGAAYHDVYPLMDHEAIFKP